MSTSKKSSFFWSAALLIWSCVTAHAAGSSHWGAGAMLGDPSGLSAKLWLSEERAMDFGLAYSLDDYLVLNADYLVHTSSLSGVLKTQESFFKRTRAYVGIGGAILLSANSRNKNSTVLGVRVPLGLEWTLSPVGIFLELDPSIGLLPSTSGSLGGTVGARYYFR